MKFAKPMALLCLLPLGSMTQGCALFAGGRLIQAAPSACSMLIPDSWHKPVVGADLPGGNTVGDWIAFGDAQTGRLDVANGREADTLAIVGRCETRDRAAVAKSRPKVLGVF